VDATAAGTLKIIVIIEFRFRNIKIVATRLAKKLQGRKRIG
jgi:hypothetical protein